MFRASDSDSREITRFNASKESGVNGLIHTGRDLYAHRLVDNLMGADYIVSYHARK